ncbi:hypothetical protein J132_03056 [Termitomyces sp. J132]|nr:hypothetical protein J132_03056 [Termitomyces sp. J132]
MSHNRGSKYTVILRGCDPSSSPALDSLLLSIEPPVSSASSRTTFTIGHFSISSSPANPVARTSLLQPTSTTTVVITFNTIPVQTSVSISGSTQSILSNLSPLRPTSSTRMQSNDIPGGAIAGGVIGALVALGALIIFLVFLRRRRRFTSSLIPVPLPYDVNYVQPLEKRNYEKEEAVEQWHDELQAEEVHPRNAHGGPLQLATIEMSSGGVQAEQEFEILRRRIIELEEQQRVLENQQSSLPLPPGYSI